uniref:uncharacterized protein LOC122587797 n=1 Tax=Erigeron canadensis TaxID=72917 RepID=UPI001CB9A75A|nr:uncharacterized protein LOC122587797 [Erigeron canadensis]
MIQDAGFNLDTKVVSVVENINWTFPSAWDLAISPPLLQDNTLDVLKWETNDGRLEEFSVALAWDELRPHAPLVAWYHVVWYPQCIPKHSFLLWLVIKRKLKTQDMLRHWDIHPSSSSSLLCPFCNFQPDSHSYLFFDCAYSLRVWNEANKVVGVSQDVGWDDIMRNMM